MMNVESGGTSDSLSASPIDTKQGANSSADSQFSSGRWRYGLYAVLAGIVAILAALGATLLAFSSADDVSAVLGVVIAPISTIVGAYFGIQAGNENKAKSQESADKANDRATAFAALADKDDHGVRQIAESLLR